ncbi:MAG TPA: T9SS type A sorting domain-containing protein, partial [Flavobacteriaceae bacterium]|nr:T9SS type A sorting domain-containing protein [Flavobacteriaceae bacterium]
TTTYTVYATYNGCVSEDTVTVHVNAADTVTAFAGNDVSICQGESTTLTASGGDNYVWSNGATTQSITVQPSATATYTVTVSSGTASDSDDVIVTVKPLPVAQVSNNITIETGMSTTLTASGGNTYEWNTGATSANITVSPTQTTTYSVLAFINGCYDEASVTVTVVAPVNAYAGEDTEICLGEITTLTAQGGISYLWNTGETTQNIQVSPEETTEYTVTVSNGINSETDSVMVEVDPDCTDLGVGEPGDVTNPFSFVVYPNPTHDIINVKLTGLSSISSLRLFDVVGKLLIDDTVGNNGSEINKQYNLSRFPRGMYLLTLVKNGKPHTKKIILN